MEFDGNGDFLRTQNDDRLNLVYNQTDNFVIETKVKINRPFSPMRILGKIYGPGWMISYSTFQSGAVTFSIGNVNKEVYVLNADTNWHSYKICFSKDSSMLTTYVDGIITNEYTNYTYGNTLNGAAFSVGNTGFPATFGFNSYFIYDGWFKGGIDFLKLDKNNLHLLNYNFDEGIGQYARDSASYFIMDRVLPGVSSCGALHFMLGYMPASDTCDPKWISDANNYSTDFYPLSTGMSYYYQGEYGTSFMESFSISLTLWNGLLVNGGLFNRAGNTEVKNIAMWNGIEWYPVGGGFNHEVVCLASYEGDLYAGGYFDTAYGSGYMRYISKWNGSQWQDVGGGANDLVTVMKEFNGELIVGGFFMSVGEMYAPAIARWDGTTWHSMSNGITGYVKALCVYNGELYAAGSFLYAGTEVCNGIAKWDGTNWHAVGQGVAGGEATLYSLSVYNGELWAGGSFYSMDGISALNIARFNGTRWSEPGQGASGMSCYPSEACVTDLKVCKGSLYAVGPFTKIGGVYANKIASYNGSYWCPVEFGVDVTPVGLEVYKGDLIVNGFFASISGRSFGNIAVYKPQNTFLGNPEKEQEEPRQFTLYQNYPNPFNPSTVIKYELRAANYIKLSVYDITGREVTTLVNEKQNSGLHNVEFDGTSFSSGIYLYRIQSDDYIEIKKMALIK